MNPNLLAAIIDGTATGIGLTFPGVVDPYGVIHFMDGGNSGNNNRSMVCYGGSRFARKVSGYNKFVDTTEILEGRFDDYTYYESAGA